MAWSEISTIFLWLACLLQFAWAVKLLRLRALSRYPVLFAFLLFSSLQAPVAQILYRLYDHTASRWLYAWYWVITVPLLWTLSFCLIVEIYNRMLVGFQGLQQLGQIVMYIASAAVGLLFLSMLFLEASANTWLQFWIRQESGAYLALTVFCLLLVSFAAFFHLSIPRNARIVFAVFGFLFAANAIFVVLEAEFGPEIGAARNQTMPALTAVGVLLGVMAFSQTGEHVASFRPAGATLDQQTEASISRGLRSFNEVLLKVLKS